MIEVTLNQPEFEYDIHSLIKAFYPSEYVGVSAEKKEYDEPVTSRVHVEYTDAAITPRWQQGETMPAAERTRCMRRWRWRSFHGRSTTASPCRR